ncbi:flagellar export protein FliJ [Vogesella oryzae]|uniref:flagellar export protein FliJ n=1 Tax=Vogesella oryzae TaxID=1735285 RepID=UPI001581BD83|nr:flagellar export protein FliJ [Vogesella oryzae]
MSKFDLLLRLASDKVDAAAERMRKAQQQQLQAQQTLQQLESFIADYQQQMLQRGQAGMSVTQWSDYRLFMQKLDDAREQQQQELERSLQRFAVEKQGWLQERRKLKSYEVLQKRELRRADLAQRRREQKTLDEFSARLKKP